MIKTIAALGMILALSLGNAAETLKAFPPAGKGMARHVLDLPQQADESLLKVELIVGKTVEVDTVNRFFFGGKIEEINLEGWGYTYFMARTLGPLAGTRMAPADGKDRRKSRFVALGGEPYLIRYNSRLPVVVYVPEGVEVRYRLWRAQSGMHSVPREKTAGGPRVLETSAAVIFPRVIE